MFSELIDSAISRQNLKETVWKAKALPAEAGVYALLHRDSGKIYIGSAAGVGGIRTRVARHRRDMRLHRHFNRHIQAYHDKHGMGSFDVLVLEITDDARGRERALLERWRPWEHGFNSDRVVDDLWTMAPEQKEFLSGRMKRPFNLQHEGVVYSGTNLTAFCKERGLHQGAMAQVNLGKKIQFKGWTLPGKARPSRWLHYHPTGELVEVPYYSATKFAEERGVGRATVIKLLSGEQKIFMGWSLAGHQPTAAELQYSLLPMEEKRRRNLGPLARRRSDQSDLCL